MAPTIVSAMTNPAILLNKPTINPIPLKNSPGDYKKGQSRRKVQMFGERAHAAGKTRSAKPTQQLLRTVGKEYDS
jgi:hypothetical protein